MKRIILVTLAACAALLHASHVHAVVSSGCGQWYSAGGGFSVGYSALFGTTCYYDLTYGPTMTPGKPVDLVFSATGGITYLFDTNIPGTVHNRTAFDWDDYHFELGSGTLASFTNFGGASLTPGFTQLVANGNSFPVSDGFDMVAMSAHSIAFFGGSVPTLSDVNFRVGVTVPVGFTAPTFTLRQHFSVPEPGTFALLGLGLAGIGAIRRKKSAA
jgi:hypothetical protein